MMPDCYAQADDNVSQETMRALIFNAEGQYISSLGLGCMGLLQQLQRHRQYGQPGTFEEHVMALLQRYKQGNEFNGHTIQIQDFWQLSASLSECLRTTFPVCYERFASPLDVHASTKGYWTDC